MIEGASESEVLQAVLPRLEAEGYEVFLQPSGSALQPFFKNFRPDAIAIGKNKNLVIEVMRDSVRARHNVEQIQQLLKDQPKWELRVFWVAPRESRQPLAPQSRERIQEQVDEARALLGSGHRGSALLSCWASLEAICRTLLPETFARPQTPNRLVEILGSEGFITPKEADRLRPLAGLRNEFIHGNLQAAMNSKEIAFFIETLTKLETLLGK